jgi:hypothetical protein
VRRSQKNGPMLFFIKNEFYTWKYDRLFPSVKNILNKENILYVRHVARGPHVVCGPHENTNVTHMALGGPSVWHAWPREWYSALQDLSDHILPYTTCSTIVLVLWASHICLSHCLQHPIRVRVRESVNHSILKQVLQDSLLCQTCERRLCLLNAKPGKFSPMCWANTVSGHVVDREIKTFRSAHPTVYVYDVWATL